MRVKNENSDIVEHSTVLYQSFAPNINKILYVQNNLQIYLLVYSKEYLLGKRAHLKYKKSLTVANASFN